MRTVTTTRLIPALALALLTLSGCDKPAEKAAPTDKAPADPSLVTVAPALMSNLVIGQANPTEVRDELRFAGRAQVDEQRITRIGASVTGRITHINAVLGQEVRNGMVLATLNSTELGEAQLAYLKARSQHKLMEAAVTRARMLLEAEVIGSAELLKRESELTSARADMDSGADQLKVLGMSPAAIKRLANTGNIDSTSHVHATLSGTVIARDVTQGQVVQPADSLFTVADLSHVWIVADVPEQQADLVRKGDQVEIEIPALQNRRISGRLIFVGDTVNPDTRTVRVHTDIVNTDRTIKPDMLANMLVKGKPQTRSTIPAAAVVRDNDKDQVFVQTGPNQFRLQPVTLSPERDGQRVVLSGLQPQDKIVRDGAFHLNNERKRKELEE